MCTTMFPLVLILSVCWIHVESQCTQPCSSATGCNHLHNRNAGYCARTYYVQRSQQSSRYTDEHYRENYETKCGFLGWGRCRRYRSKTRARHIYYTSYWSSHQCSRSCCSGYTGNAPSNCRPICSAPCYNGGRCTSPYTCTCTSGWIGPTCLIAVCSPPCQNGGDCSSPGYCNCDRSRWTGNRCEQAVCSPPCQNGGVCSSPGFCNCDTARWKGSRCEQAVCLPVCANGGSCTSPGVCRCASGWSGSRCTDPVCSPSCANGGTCTAPNTCSCTPSWAGATCTTDVNECSTGVNRCQHYCINTLGSFRCECRQGYALLPNGYQCRDINECIMGTDVCSQRCLNTEGSFQCSCFQGFQLQGLSMCTDINECESNPRPCEHTCTNNEGSFTCGCNEGYRLQGETDCIDIDECTDLKTKPCAQTCTNNVGSFTCGCTSGYKLAGDGLTCNDINECETNQNDCSQRCENTDGSFLCSCNQGFFLKRNRSLTSCEKFELATALNTPSAPVNLGFLNWIKDGLASCVSGSVCICIRDLFMTLSAQGYTQGTIQVKGSVFFIALSTEKPQAVSDLILAIFGSDSTIVLPIVANIKELSYDCTTQEFYLETFQAGGELKIFPNIVTLSMVNLRVRISNVWSSPKLESLELIGTFKFGSIVLDAFVETINPDLWKFGANIKEDNDISLIELLDSAIHVKIPSQPLGNLLTISALSINGLVDIASDFKFLIVLRGTIRVSNFYEESACIIIHQSLSDIGRVTPQLGFISGCVEAKELPFGILIGRLTGLDLSTFGFFNKFMLPKFHIVYTTSSFAVDVPRLSLLGFTKGLEFGLDVNFSGFRFIFDFYIEKLNAFKPWIFYKDGGSIAFRPISFDLDGFTLADMVSTLSQALSLPNVNLFRMDLNGLLLRGMNLDLDLKELALNIEIPEEITIFIDLFHISRLTIDFNIILDDGITFNTFSIAGILKLGQSTFDVSISYDQGVYELSACAKDFKAGFSGIASALGSSFDSSIAVTAFGFGDIGLFDPCFAIKFKVGQFPVYMCFSADLFRGEFADVGISACVTQEKKWVFGFEIREFVIAKLLEQIIGRAGRQVSFFNQKLYTAVIVAPIVVDDLPLQGVLLEQIDNIAKGTTIIATSEWPRGCDSDPFCSVARRLIGNDLEIFLIIHIIQSSVSVEARVQNFTMGGFTLSAASIQMMFGPGLFSIGIAAEMEINNPPVKLIGALRLKFPQSQISLEMKMSGCWKRAFGISILEICNFFISVSILPGSPLPGIAFGVTVKIGDERCYVLQATGFFGINPNDPTDNYFYVDISSLTLQRVVDLFCININLPHFLADTGFPDGLTTSFALKPHTFKDLGITIPRGFYFKGTVNIFGLKVECEMTLDPPRLIEVKARLSPLNLAGGLLKMSESRAVADKGPFLYVMIQSNPLKFKAEASGYVSVLGISAEAKLVVSNSGFEVSVFGSIFRVLEAELTIKASIGKVLDASFSVAGKVKFNILQRIQDAVISFIQKAGKTAEEAISGAQNKIEEAKKVFDQAKEQFQRAADKVQGARNKVSYRRKKLGELRARLCQYKSCGRVCIPFFRASGCLVRGWRGKCIIPRFKWDKCAFKLPDPICLAYNVWCGIKRLAINALILLAKAALLLVEGILAIAEAAIHGLKVIVDATKIILDVAIAALEVVKVTVAVGLKALEAITKFLLTGIINIKEIGFDVHLSLFSHGRISAYVVASFFGSNPITLQVTIPLINPLAIAKDLAERAIPGLGRKKRNMKAIEKVLWLANRFRTHGTIYPSTWGK